MIESELIVEARHTDQTGVIRTARQRADGVRMPRLAVLDECRYCQTRFRAHPGFADHQDRCRLNPMNRPHIHGEAVAISGGHDV